MFISKRDFGFRWFSLWLAAEDARVPDCCIQDSVVPMATYPNFAASGGKRTSQTPKTAHHPTVFPRPPSVLPPSPEGSQPFPGGCNWFHCHLLHCCLLLVQCLQPQSKLHMNLVSQMFISVLTLLQTIGTNLTASAMAKVLKEQSFTAQRI